ncbi:DUF5662 family protein [Clostridium sp.]|uniref:DUF5662 family protein n=1 Tax=Clostridium sp. TaxID=1506 RepID=UPI003F3F91FC
MGIYIDYFKYVVNHKKNVFKVCINNDDFIHGITHDLSKFLPSEFIPYAKWFYGEYGVKFKDKAKELEDAIWCCDDKVKLEECENELRKYHKCKREFEVAWCNHYRRNKHHWNYYYNYIRNRCKDMDDKYIKQMVYDWMAMGMVFGDTAQSYYLNNYNKIELSEKSRYKLEKYLELHNLANIPRSDFDWEHHTTLGKIVKRYRDNGELEILSSMFKDIDKKYNVNTLELIEKK